VANLKTDGTTGTNVFNEYSRLVTKNIDVFEIFVFGVAAVILFMLGWEFGRESVEGPGSLHNSARSYNRFGRVQQQQVYKVPSLQRSSSSP
jgi:hypothetical protein